MGRKSVIETTATNKVPLPLIVLKIDCQQRAAIYKTIENDKLLQTKKETSSTFELPEKQTAESIKRQQARINRVTRNINLMSPSFTDINRLCDGSVEALCHWCSLPVAPSIPRFMPIRYENDKFMVEGIFCSTPCLVAKHHMLCKEGRFPDKLEALCLLRLMLNRVYKHKGELRAAPPPTVRTEYLGFMTRKQYRDLVSEDDKVIKIFNPPFVPLISRVEETSVSSNQSVLTPAQQEDYDLCRTKEWLDLSSDSDTDGEDGGESIAQMLTHG